ncbi:hypothetical protein K488DRAFT_75298 [Vararia minispora EC-137]|uniref:Uncharacterized protein n=1 Tax=Vararia minispora EC-137 TaxID=1314806 RepID=A0ACB8Q462_9AGAM|nr:hypothetical protein K488DRAFT_75298 [Vararia minispora EC-137]
MATLVDMDGVCSLPSADLPLFQALLDVVPAGLLPLRARLLDALRVLASDDPPPPPTYSAVEPAADSPLGQVLAQWHAAHAPVPSSPSPGPIDLDLWDVSDDVLAAPFPSTQPPPPSASAPALVAEDAVMVDAEPPAVMSGPIPPPSAPSISALVARTPAPAAASVVGTPIPQPAPAPPPLPAITSGTPGPAIDSTLPADMSWEYWSANIADALCCSREARARALVRAAIRRWGWLKTQTMYACIRAATVTTTSAVSDIASFAERLGGRLHDYVESQAPISTGRKRVRTSTGSEALK